MLFVPLVYTLATEEAERIGVDHVARMSSTEAGESSLVAEHLTAQHSAIKMLHSRVRLVLEYMKAVQNGQLPTNHEILREVYSLCHRLPVIQSPRFRQDFYNVSILCNMLFCRSLGAHTGSPVLEFFLSIYITYNMIYF